MKFKDFLLDVFIISCYILFWELMVKGFKIPDRILPPPTAILSAFLSTAHYVLVQSFSTVIVIVSGLVPAIIIGIFLGACISEWKFVRKMLLPLVSSSQVIPKTAIIPLFLAWHLGYSTTSKSIITFLISFYPVLLGTCLGFSRISDDFIFLFKSFGASRLQTLFRLKLPASVPHIVTGIKAAALYSVIGAITSEIFMGGQGIGYVINFSSEKLNMEMTFVGLTIATIIGSLFFAGISIFESTFVKKRWGGS